MALHGSQPYEVSKSCADLIAQSYFHTHGLPVGISRFGNIHGGGDLNWSSICLGTIQGRVPIIRSDGGFLRDYMYVKDAVSAYLCIAKALISKKIGGEAFNISPANAYTVLEVVQVIKKSLGCPHLLAVIENNAPGEIRDQYLDGSKTQNLLGWMPAFDLDKGMVETITWYRKCLEMQPAKASEVNWEKVCHV